ncbi:diaminopimelate epimerase [Tropicimonas sp.]|uniref:diaminopimelate epimerase n=1 Tax=Tropicimonas sp. TaxID=2067044 RepID=UPI003A89DB90
MVDADPLFARRFIKMHGLGNDFVVVDRRAGAPAPDAALVRALGDRHRGVGFDQLVLIEPDDRADARLVFFNADGSVSAACGNATRCVARLLMDETGATNVTLRTGRGVLECADAGDGLTRVNMGHPMTDWREIPLAEPLDTLALPIDGAPTATGMGNPHCTFFVGDAEAVDLATFGPAHEHHPLFPERTNVQVAQVIGPDRLRMRVWERGAGVTLASGSSSCATAVAAARRGLTGRSVTVELDGGTIGIDWRQDGVHMTGPTAYVFDGVLGPAFPGAI